MERTALRTGLAAGMVAADLVCAANFCISFHLYLGARNVATLSVRSAHGLRMEVFTSAGNCEPGGDGCSGRAEVSGYWQLATEICFSMLHLILFSVFGLVCVAGAVNLLLQSHPINSALSLVVVMGSLAVEFLLLGAEFVAAIQVIVYAGAVMVLFVFVIMLLNAGEEERTRGNKVALSLGVPGLVVFFGLMCWTLSAAHSQLGRL